MEKQKRWQLYLILAVIVLTLYNILPTIFYYAQPLKTPIDAPRAEQVAQSIGDRINVLEEDSKEWLYSFSKLLHVKPTSIVLDENDPRLIEVSFNTQQDAALFRRFLPQAGALISFVPAQLELDAGEKSRDPTKVVVSRHIGLHINPQDSRQLFSFVPKYDEESRISDAYRILVNDRATQLAMAFGGASKNAQQAAALITATPDARHDEVTIALAKDIADVNATFKDSPEIAKRYYASFSQIDSPDAAEVSQKFLARVEAVKKKLTGEIESILNEQKTLEQNKLKLDSARQQTLSFLENQRRALTTAAELIKKHSSDFKTGKKPLTADEAAALLAESKKSTGMQIFSLEGRNPFIESLAIDWDNNKIVLVFYKDIEKIRDLDTQTESAAFLQEKTNQFVINDIARASSLADETVMPDANTFSVALNKLTDPRSFLVLNLGSVAEKQIEHILSQLQTGWNPKQADLNKDSFPILTYDEYKKLKPEDQKLGLVVYAPASYKEPAREGFRTGSIYVIARGLSSIMQKYQEAPNSPDSKTFSDDLSRLNTVLLQNGFIGYSGSSYGMAPEFAQDYIFELDDYYSNLVGATREDFSVKGSKRYAVLDFTDVEQRILTWNKIEDRIQEDLIKWKETYNAAQVDLNSTSRYQVPAPTRNVFWENFKLSAVKYFTGDERKILKWGLDLSGGKTVRIGLRDHNNRPVTNPDDLKQAVNELYTRINKMGVSERTIHIENENIVLDFPGSQNLSAAELVKASAMYFHIVNEKFTPGNPSLKDTVNQFLQNVWNEAVVTNRKDASSINAIAWQHLGGENLAGSETRPRSEAAGILWDNGLRLANPKDSGTGRSFNDVESAVGIMRGDDFSEWDNQTHPLLVIFSHYALDGSSLDDVRVGYDPSEGNNLTFGIKSSYEGSEQGSPRDDFYSWTSQFSEDKIAGTPKEAYAKGQGYRMAVILNGTIISKPHLKAALRDGATISGRFSQREINGLAADLKAGSLSFTPYILSEQNVSPELGKEERFKGILASFIAIVAVVVAMVSYYHFAGVVASVAVLFNLLIMWGILQNLGAALSLPSIAGIVLAIGMAVDANVLVFERIREEFKISGRIASAIQAGYRKAFSAIVDSNITTIIAALILIQFDSGPIKGFAVSLIVGIISSMFTSLFMTRFFFAGWVQNPQNKSLRMSQFIGHTQFDFLAQTKKAVTISLVVMLLGSFVFVSERKTMFGMDFTGGYSLAVDLEEQPSKPNYRLAAIDALEAAGAPSTDFQVRELSRPNQLRIQLAMSMEQNGHPFYRLPETIIEGKFAHNYQHSPRLSWVVDALAKGGVPVQASQLNSLDKDWTVMSGQFSDAMRNNAIIALSVALISILAYITLRFEFNFAIAAVVGLLHDVIITMGILAFFHKMGFAVQIDLQVVGAIMTIIGYSLNDTIIVFDRIREDMKILKKLSFKEIINHALNITLSRTIMTSGTTILVLLALVLLGGKSIFAFSLVMTIGIVVGTLSSLFIASPVLLYFHNRQVEREENARMAPRRT